MQCTQYFHHKNLRWIVVKGYNLNPTKITFLPQKTTSNNLSLRICCKNIL